MQPKELTQDELFRLSAAEQKARHEWEAKGNRQDVFDHRFRPSAKSIQDMWKRVFQRLAASK